MFVGQKILIKGGDRSTMKKKRVAVVGCGVAGLVSVKSVLEDGHDAVGFERQPDIGGLWNWEAFGTEKGHSVISDPDVHCYPAYSSLSTNTTRYNTMFSDFMPLDADGDTFLEFMPVNDVCKYAKAYADDFQLMSHIRLNSNVVRIDKEGTDKWLVTFRNGENTLQEKFDNIIITIGAFAYPRYRDNVNGAEKFKNLLVHSGQVRNGEPLFGGKRALIIGGAYSAGEMMEMALCSGVKKLYVSPSRRPETKSAWTIDRHVKSIYGDIRPWDYLLTRENALVNSDGFSDMLSAWCYALHKAQPDSKLVHPGDAVGITTVNVVEKGRQDGILEMVGPVSEITEKGVGLRDGTRLDDLDVIVTATGFQQKFPFLDHVWSGDEQLKCELYNYVVSPNPVLDGIGFVLMQPASYSLLPSGELQARWFVNKIVSRVYNEDGTIFTAQERTHMRDAMVEKQSKRPPCFPFNYIDDVPLLMEYLAVDMGVGPPDYKELIKSDEEHQVELGVALLYGPYVGTQYRITGPHSWPQAAQECINLSKRFLGKHFDDYVMSVKQNKFPSSGKLDMSKGPYNVYT